MRSQAHFKAHPLHPALIPFPFAFLCGAFGFDLLGWTTGQPSLWQTGAHLTVAGIAAGLFAAVPGIVDYVYTVPPRSSGKARATRHGLTNAAALALFAAAWLLRADDGAPTMTSLTIELAGTAALMYAGWLGGTLVGRNLISVDHRYAQAGTWQEADFTARAGEPLTVGSADDLAEGQMKLLHINGHRIVLARTSDGYAAFDDRCSHRGGSLAGGVLIGNTVQCLWHGSQFDTGNGEVRCGPATQRIRVYEVKQTKNGQVLIVAPPG